MLFWPRRFLPLSKENRCYVIRYDYRDTGKSITVAPGAATYTLSDFVDEALHILDQRLVKKVRLMGFSFGADIAQLLAVRNPDRVTSDSHVNGYCWSLSEREKSASIVTRAVAEIHQACSSKRGQSGGSHSLFGGDGSVVYWVWTSFR
jgi:pimeloyl-ACP methyl ester carboxylesterase